LIFLVFLLILSSPLLKAMNDDELGMAVSLSVGELPKDDYERLFRAGTRRYLLRIETSNPDLYKLLHPSAMSWHGRVECLRNLREVRMTCRHYWSYGPTQGAFGCMTCFFIVPQIGYMIGTGVMVGLPGQTLRDLAGDIVFFKEIGANMIGGNGNG